MSLIGTRAAQRPAPTWPLTLALLVPPVLGLRLTTVLDYLGFAGPTADNAPLTTIGVIQCAVLVGTGALLASVAAHRLRQLPAAASPTAPHTESLGR